MTDTPQRHVPTKPPLLLAAFGSASILPITWMYLTMMGKQGMEQATRWALLNANYVAKRLSEDYPILYAAKRPRDSIKQGHPISPF